MKISFFTNIRTPYRTKQFDTIASNTVHSIDIYYVDQKTSSRKWKLENAICCKEVDINTENLIKKLKTIYNIVKDSDIVLIGGHEYTEYVMASILSILLKKKQVLLCDGISAERLNVENLSFQKKIIKSILIKNTVAIFGNGKVTEKYFVEKYHYSISRIFNQYLTVDTKEIISLSENSSVYKKILREKYNIDKDKKVLIYCGRLVELKNIKIIIDALSETNNKENIVFFIIGGGIEQEKYQKYALDKGVQILFTGFLPESKEVYKHYFIGDCFILPSYSESWGLVINEAAAAGLPILCSKHVGASLDFINEGKNGYLFSPFDKEEITNIINKIFYEDDYVNMGKQSKKISEQWTFDNSSKSFNALIKSINQGVVKVLK